MSASHICAHYFMVWDMQTMHIETELLVMLMHYIRSSDVYKKQCPGALLLCSVYTFLAMAALMQFYNISYVCTVCINAEEKENCCGNTLMSISNYPLINQFYNYNSMKYQNLLDKSSFVNHQPKGLTFFNIA